MQFWRSMLRRYKEQITLVDSAMLPNDLAFVYAKAPATVGGRYVC